MRTSRQETASNTVWRCARSYHRRSGCGSSTTGYDLALPDLQAYLKQLTKAQEADGFSLAKPSRWSYFRHFLEYPRVYGKILSPRHQLYSYIRAFGALLLGYDRLSLLDDLRRAYKSILGKPKRESAISKDKTKATGKNQRKSICLSFP